LGSSDSGSLPVWIGFTLFVLAMLALDLGVFHRRAHVVRTAEALAWSGVWITLSLLFCAGVWHWDGAEKGLEFLTAWLVEKSLSVDNLFVFLVTFSYFGVGADLQHRVLVWGVLGALVMRAAFIFAGGAILHAFHFVLYALGAFLVFTGARLLFQKEIAVHPEHNPVLRLFRRLVPAVADYRGARFVVREGGRLLATPLLFVLVVIEASDIMFAVDSIPAVFGITEDVFVVYTSNIFAILGLRALYFVLAGYLGRFVYLRVGLAVVLAFVGAKMLASAWVKVPILMSLGVVAVLIGGSVAASLIWGGKARREGPAEQARD